MGWEFWAHLYLRLSSYILFHQALRILDIRPIIRVRLLEGHINEEALKVIWNFQPRKAALQTFNFCSFFQHIHRKGHKSGAGFWTPALLFSVLSKNVGCCWGIIWAVTENSDNNWKEFKIIYIGALFQVLSKSLQVENQCWSFYF